MRIKLYLLSIIFIPGAAIFATDFGNPADMPPKGSIEAAADYSKHFIYTENDAIHSQFISQRLLVRIGYVFYKWLQLSLFVGGADGDLITENFCGGSRINGSWELSPGAGIRIKPPLKFDALGMRFHLLIDGRYLFIRSRLEKFQSNNWEYDGIVHLNEFDAAGLAVGYMRKFNLSFYAGIGMGFVWSEMPYTRSRTVVVGSQTVTQTEDGTEMLGVSPSTKGKFFPHMVFPLFGVNWHFAEGYAFSVETYLADIQQIGDMNPKVGFSIGLSNYK